MKKTLYALVIFCISTIAINSQTIKIFDNVPFYSMYHYLGEGETLPPEAFSQIPVGAIRLHAYERDIISRKLTEAEIASIGQTLTMNVDIIAACDNYDRLAGVNLALVPKGASTYTWEQADVKRIEIARFITPFLNKNNSPTTVPYSYNVSNLTKILHNSTLQSQYDFWIEFRADGYSAAANTQVAGCADRTDVFRGSLQFVTSGTDNASSELFLPLAYRDRLNKYNATDVPGQTTKIVNFTLDSPVENAVLYFITSNHGANSGGEEYVRRNHFLYLDDQLIMQYKPGGKSCEPYRQYNTQGNGIYGTAVKPLRDWMSWNNWCPGDAVPNREINLGNLSAGQHTIKLDVPDATFNNNEGNFPVSMYIQDAKSGQIICAPPSQLKIDEQISNSLKISWQETGNATQWQTLWARKNAYATNLDNYRDINLTPETTLDNLTTNWFYEIYVKSKCSNDVESVWTGPVYSNLIKLGIDEAAQQNIEIYPNPAKDIITVKSPTAINTSVLYSIDGKKIGETNSPEINISKLQSGEYVLLIKLKNGKTVVKKFLKN